jgi:uncharacterized membrane protein YqjE
VTNGNGKSVTEVIENLKEELKEFVTTRLAMLRSELDDKYRSFKTAAPVMTIGIGMLGTAWLLFTGFLVCIIAQAFAPSPWDYAVSFILVTVLYAIVGGLAAYLAWRQLMQKGVKPERTIRVLQQDRIWLQAEGKSQL